VVIQRQNTQGEIMSSATEIMANEIVTEDVNDSINASTFSWSQIPWTQILGILVQILIAVTPYLLASAGITLALDTPGVQAQAYVNKRHKKRSGLFDLLLVWKVRHHIEKQAKAHKLVLTTVQAEDLTNRLLNKVRNAPVDNLNGVIKESLSQKS
jgi:hypothetical protein